MECPDTKFTFGQEVWIIYLQFPRATKSCGFCAGTGYVLGVEDKDDADTCPRCQGKGTVEYNQDRQWIVGKRSQIIKQIRLTYRPKSCTLSYQDTQVAESEIFASSEEAQKECDRRNLLLAKRAYA